MRDKPQKEKIIDVGLIEKAKIKNKKDQLLPILSKMIQELDKIVHSNIHEHYRSPN